MRSLLTGEGFLFHDTNAVALPSLSFLVGFTIKSGSNCRKVIGDPAGRVSSRRQSRRRLVRYKSWQQDFCSGASNAGKPDG
jgi:hypothetical protein